MVAFFYFHPLKSAFHLQRKVWGMKSSDAFVKTGPTSPVESEGQRNPGESGPPGSVLSSGA